MNMYCLFCETGKCEYIRRAVIDTQACRVISPKQMQHTWSGGRMVDRERDLLPGYLFLYFEEEEKLNRIRLRQIPGIIRCLRDTSQQYELTGVDAQFALMLLKHGGTIGKTPVYREGQRIRISEGAFAGLQTKILKVDHRASRMQVEIPFAHQQVRTWLEYEIVESDEPEIPEESDSQ